MKRFGAWMCLVFLAISTEASYWETCNSGRCGVELAGSDQGFGGVFTRSRDFHYVANTRIGGRLRRSDRLEATGRVSLAASPGFSGSVNVGHFETYGGHSDHTDFVGIRFSEYAPGQMRAQAFINFNRGIQRQGAAIILPVGEYDWGYDWFPDGGLFGCGLLRVTIRGAVSGVSEVQLGYDCANLHFACNAFGIHSGYAENESPETASVWVSNLDYNVLATPVITRTRMPVFLLIGQGNARGGDSSMGALQLVPQRLQNVYLYTDQWTYAAAPSEPRNYFGPELSLGRELAAALKQPVAIIKVTRPNGTLEENWLPELDLTYRQLVDTTRLALRGLRSPAISGVFSVQGEPDSASYNAAQNYARNLGRLLAALRRDLKVPQLPLVVSRQLPCVPAPYANVVRLRQQQFPWIDTDDLSNVGDFTHYNGTGLVAIGERLARGYVQFTTPSFGGGNSTSSRPR
jgi:hypothetical protein